MSPADLFAIVAGLAVIPTAAIGAWATNRASKRAAAKDEKTIEAKAFERAQSIEHPAVKFLESQYERVTKELTEVRAELMAQRERSERQDADLARERSARLHLEEQLSEANRKVSDLTARLAAAGIALTPTQES